MTKKEIEYINDNGSSRRSPANMTNEDTEAVHTSFPVSHKVGNVVNFVLDFKCK